MDKILAPSPRVECFYFGCIERSGHFLWKNQTGHFVGSYQQLAFHFAPLQYLDSCYCPRKERYQGAAQLTHTEKFTVLAFWDNSIDKRGGSHSTFVLPGRLNFEQALALAKREFPDIWARYTFDVKLVKTHEGEITEFLR